MKVRTTANSIDQGVLADGTVVGMGLLPSNQFKLAAAEQALAAIPLVPRADWPRKGGGVRSRMPWRWDQARQSSCCGHGAAAAMTAAVNLANTGHELVELSPTYVYGKIIVPGTDNGAMIDDAMDQLQAGGVCLRTTVGPGAIDRRRFPDGADAEAARFRADRCLVFRTFDELASLTLSAVPCFTGIWCGRNYTPDSLGRLGEFSGHTEGGHATAQIGELEFFDGRGWGVWTLGSWGSRFGQDGWYWKPESYFRAGLGTFGGVAVLGVRPDPLDPTPSPTPSGP
ncbi:MAG: hypothetical protein K2X82_08470 [Gemmataceae bacterium]|nr:hypothetical protein [Gemmataceae bacterium]